MSFESLKVSTQCLRNLESVIALKISIGKVFLFHISPTHPAILTPFPETQVHK